MRNAALGDDVMGDDPTVLLLETKAATMAGKEASLFVPSGTMGNLLAIMTHCRVRGAEMIVGDKSHIFLHEAGGSASLAGVHTKSLPNQADGTLRLQDIRDAILEDDVHHATSRLICLENTQNVVGGVPLALDYIEKVSELARCHSLAFHMDGARLFNAAAALGCEIDRIVAPADSAMFCLSKGLAAPIGSMLVGEGEFIAQARKFRKMLGGGMRQVGGLAAAGIVALESMPKELLTDHRMAHLLADGIEASVPGLQLIRRPLTNMVYAWLAPCITKTVDEITLELNGLNVLVWGNERERQFRFVMHYHIREAEVAQLVEALRQVIK